MGFTVATRQQKRARMPGQPLITTTAIKHTPASFPVLLSIPFVLLCSLISLLTSQFNLVKSGFLSELLNSTLTREHHFPKSFKTLPALPRNEGAENFSDKAAAGAPSFFK